MNDLVRQMVDKVGIDKGTAEKVFGLLQENAAKVPAMLSGDAESFTPLLTKLGVDNATATKIFNFLKEHASDVTKLLPGQTGGFAQKAKDMIGGMLGRKS